MEDKRLVARRIVRVVTQVGFFQLGCPQGLGAFGNAQADALDVAAEAQDAVDGHSDALAAGDGVSSSKSRGGRSLLVLMASSKPSVGESRRTRGSKKVTVCFLGPKGS